MLADATTDVINKEQPYNIIYVNTPTGLMKIKSQLTGEQWIKAQELRLKKQPKKTKRK